LNTGGLNRCDVYTRKAISVDCEGDDAFIVPIKQPCARLEWPFFHFGVDAAFASVADFGDLGQAR